MSKESTLASIELYTVMGVIERVEYVPATPCEDRVRRSNCSTTGIGKESPMTTDKRTEADATVEQLKNLARAESEKAEHRVFKPLRLDDRVFKPLRLDEQNAIDLRRLRDELMELKKNASPQPILRPAAPVAPNQTIALGDSFHENSPRMRRIAAQSLVLSGGVVSHDLASTPFAPRVYCVACRRDASVLHHEEVNEINARLMWFECHGEHRLVRVLAESIFEGQVRSDCVQDLRPAVIKIGLANARALIEEGTARVRLLERFIAAEQRTRR